MVANMKCLRLAGLLGIGVFAASTPAQNLAADIAPITSDYVAHVETLASDSYLGRAPATDGGAKTVAFLEHHFQRIGLQPGNGESYRQRVPLVEIIASEHSAMSIHGAKAALNFDYQQDMMAGTKRQVDTLALTDSDLVFVGYGIVAPEYDWDDYEGLDVDGKTVVMLVNDPGYATGNPELFNGNAMTYYGRWTYKYEEAARQGAAGALVIHETDAAGYGWEVVASSWAGAQYTLDETNPGYQLAVEGWLSSDAAEAVFAQAGMNLEQARQQALTPSFKPISLQQTVSVSFANQFRRSASNNVIGYLPGSQRPGEFVVYMAHWDHLGTVVTDHGIDVYNGAVDNATGTAGLIALAERFSQLEQAPARSVAFMAWTAEESGLLGSRFYGENPLFPHALTVGGMNMDALNVYGPTHDVTVVGYGASELDAVLRRHADAQGRRLEPDASPEKGFYYRSDHFNLARHGVPMIYAKGGRDYIGRDAAYAQQVVQDYRGRYHQTSDEIHALWNFDGLHQDLWLFYQVGLDLAKSEVFPNWAAGNEFRAVRDASAAQRQRPE
jgi:Zn-dependent M28 family amino/carboxypeptidase